MREFKTSSGKTIQIRPLVYREVKEYFSTEHTLLTEVKLFCKYQGMDEKDLLEWPMPDVVAFRNAVFNESFPSDKEVKN